MTKLKLSAIPDDRPVKIIVELPAAVHRDLVAYAEILGRAAGNRTSPDPAKLVAPMLQRFMATDKIAIAVDRPFATALAHHMRVPVALPCGPQGDADDRSRLGGRLLTSSFWQAPRPSDAPADLREVFLRRGAGLPRRRLPCVGDRHCNGSCPLAVLAQIALHGKRLPTLASPKQPHARTALRGLNGRDGRRSVHSRRL